MKLRSFFYLGLLLASSFSVFGQPTGFMGKRFFVEGQIGPSINLSFEDIYYSGYENGGGRLAPAYGLSLSMVTKRDKYLSLSFDNRNFYQDTEDIVLVEGRTDVRFKAQIQTYGLAYYATRSKRGYAAPIAPLGSFFGYKLTYNRLSAKPIRYTDSGEMLTDADSEQYDLTYQNPKAGFLGIAMVYGHRMILKEKITFFVSGELGMIFSADPDFYPNNLKRPISDGNLDYYLSSYLNINVGAGYLLF